jgi:hypothetical protein
MLLLAAAAALAFSVDKGSEFWTVHSQGFEFSLPATAVERDNATPLQFPAVDAAKAQVRAISAYEDTHAGPKVTARATKSGAVQVKVSGRNAGKM